jgi:ferric-dicitrate binding protein FerR (iron transport regulator)
MKSIVRFLACASMAFCLTAQAQSAEDVEQAKAAAETWLALADSNHHASAWAEAAEPLQQAVTQADWTQALQGLRAPLGQLKRRTVQSATFTKELPGAHAGDYVVIVFASQFANRPTAVETVTPMRTKDGSWKVSGYYLR